jgi:endonuclease/exonuclease/phosphatase (EEP) superfamily protein YafD
MIRAILSFLLTPIKLPFKALLWPAQFANMLTRLCFYGLLLATVCSFLGRYYWLFDILGEFRLQITLVLFAISVVFAATLQFKKALMGLIAVACHVLILWPYTPLGTRAQPPATGPTLTLLHANLWVQNFSLGRVVTLIERSNADVISFSEYDFDWHNGLREHGVLAKYPYAIYNDDVALYSRIPLYNARLVQTGEKTSAVGDIVFNNHPLRIIAAHTWSPISHAHYQANRNDLRGLTEFILSSRRPCVLVGDLNATAWQTGLSDLLKQTQLRDTQHFSGLQPSWPTFFILPWFSIDHVLVPQTMVATSRRVGPFIGSDHFPVLTTLRFIDDAPHAP